MSNTTNCIEAEAVIASALTTMFIIDLILGLPGNILALWILGCKAPWKAGTVYLLNLALADVLLQVGLPFRIDSLIRGSWIFGAGFCRFILFMLSVNQSGSIAFMTLLVVDRFFRIVHPHHSICKLSIRHLVMLSCMVWFVVVCLHLPLLLIPFLRSSGNSSGFVCHNIEIWTKSGVLMKVHNVFFVFGFALAFILVIVCSVRIYYNLQGNKQLRKHRRVKRSIGCLWTVISMFVFCFLPSYITGCVALFLQDVSSCSSHLVLGQIFSVSLCLAYLNSALDPVLYCLSSASFRDTMKTAANLTQLTNYRLSVKETRTPLRP